MVCNLPRSVMNAIIEAGNEPKVYVNEEYICKLEEEYNEDQTLRWLWFSQCKEDGGVFSWQY